jgi:iron complex transport system ATP-binding protein
MITTNELHIGYKHSILQVDDINLEGGNVYILLGKNGSGKSTFLKTLSGQIKPISGNSSLEGKSIADISLIDLPKQIAFVSSKLEETDYLKVYDYVALARSPYTNSFGKLQSKDIEMIESALKMMNIESLHNRFINELSDGEKQLVAITKAFAQETSVILLDEPTAFLDYTNKVKVMQSLVRIAKDFNKCILISSHDLDVTLDADCPFLIVNSNKNRLFLKGKSTNKNELIELAY